MNQNLSPTVEFILNAKAVKTPKDTQMREANTKIVYKQLARMLSYRWPTPSPLTPKKMLAWKDMSQEQRDFWVASYSELQTAVRSCFKQILNAKGA